MRERDLVSGMSVFVAVVEAGSLAAAARKSRLTASAVSKLVARLESHLGARLLRRTTRSLTVTDAGQAFYQRARGVLADLRRIEDEVGSKDAEPRGLVRMSAPQLLGQTRIVPIVISFQKKFPGVAVDLDLTDRNVDMVGERTDLAVRITSSPPPSFVARRVGQIERILCASPAYLEGAPALEDPRDLANHTCLMLGGPSSSPSWQFQDEHGARTSVRIDARLRATSTLALHEAAKAGLGVAELPGYLVDDDLRAGRLVHVLDRLAPTDLGVYVVYAPAAQLPARVRALVDHLLPELEHRLTVCAHRAIQRQRQSRRRAAAAAN